MDFDSEGDSIFFSSDEEPSSDVFTRVASEMPDEPENVEQRVLFWFYYTVQYLLLFHKTPNEVIDNLCIDGTETYADALEKAYMMVYRSYSEKFRLLMRKMADDIYNAWYADVRRRGHAKGLAAFFPKLRLHQEVHSRRIKMNPGETRTKTDTEQIAYNLVTGERYNPDNRDHQKWHLIVVNPLPSDYDCNEIDPKEGGLEHQLAIEALKDQGTYDVPEPYMVVVTPEWDTIIRTLHTALHFDDYLVVMLVQNITNEEWREIEKIPCWKDAWAYIVTDAYAKTPIDQLPNKKKENPPIIAKIVQMRNFVMEILKIAKSLKININA